MFFYKKKKKQITYLESSQKSKRMEIFSPLSLIRETRLLIISRRKFGNENSETGEKILITNFSSAWRIDEIFDSGKYIEKRQKRYSQISRLHGQVQTI